MSRNSEFEMERGVAQILNSYGARNVFDFGQLGLTMQTNPWGRVEEIDDVDRERVAKIIQSRIGRYRNRTTADEWENISADDIDLYRPLKIEGRLFPLVFYCENKSCRKVHTATEPGYLPSNGQCRACGESITQLPFVNVCTCGRLEDASPNRGCSQHGFDDIRLNKRASEPAMWRYECNKCGDTVDVLSSSCGVCNGMQGPLPTASSRIFYSEKAVEVDIPYIGDQAEDIPKDESWAHVLMAAHLGLADLESNTIENLATTEGMVDKYQKWVNRLGEEDAQEMFDDMDQDVHGRETLVAETEHITPPDTEGDVEEGTRALAYSNIAHQLFTFQRSTNGYEGDMDDLKDTRHPIPKSLSHFLQDSDFRERHPQSGRYRPQLTASHIRQAWIVDQFPLLNILYGYTRADSQSNKVDLRSFPHPRERATTPIFADRTPSEAIIFEIDRTAIINWLEANNVITAEQRPDTSDEAALKEWFLNNIATTELDNPFTPIEHDITRWVYRLLHSLSHCLLARAGEQCGLATSSLSERIFPVIPAIAVYAASTENFALGSMFTLFKTRLHPWVSDARDLADQCLIDATCRENPAGAACDACLHIEETSCEAINHHLDRRIVRSKSDIVGFWDEGISNGIPDDISQL
ncbi:hypothetical protein [Halalkalicoccus subterraneus]|uniref:hypothetical protein n=1 Tax=Halalkalicoccus subterraneus TaxID=2675002 RepID=UPI001FEBF7F2|nr:hypothetical protein [Halalkalicoccus subterraneus]